MRDNEQDRARFAEIMYGVADNFGAEVSTDGLEMRFKALSAYSLDAIAAAALALVQTRVFRGMPTVADFLEHMGGGKPEDVAEVQAALVLEAVKRVGPYSSVQFSDPITTAVVAQRFEGWEKLCDMQGEAVKWFFRDFKTAYLSFARQGMTLTGHLAGAIERQNGDQYPEHVKPPVLVGGASGNGPRIGHQPRNALQQAAGAVAQVMRMAANPSENQVRKQ